MLFIQTQNVFLVSAPKIQKGFSLLELMIVLGIIGILAAIAVPNFSDMIAEQRVRSVAADLIGDMTLARTEAIKQQRRTIVERVGANWENGWRIYVDADASGTLNGAEANLKSSAGYSGGTLKVRPITADLANQMIFRGDGTVVNVPIGTESGIRISDDRGMSWVVGDGANPGARTRDIVLSPAGRASVIALDKATGIR